MDTWFHIRAENDNPQLFIEGFIGYWPVVAEEFRMKLNEFPDAAPIEVRIDSMGGDPMTAKSIYSMLMQRSGAVHVVIENNCLSAASIIACAGDSVVMHDLGVYMIHEPEILPESWMRENEAQSVADQVRIVKEQMRDIYSSFTGINADEIANMMQATTWMNAREALDNGFVTEVEAVVPQLEPQQDIEMAALAYDVPARFRNSHNQQSKKTSTMEEWMKRLQAAFGLSEDSDQADVVLSAKEMKGELEDAQSDNTDLQEHVEELEQENTDLKEKLDKHEQEDEQAEQEEFEETLEAMVNDFQIKAGEREKYAEDFEGDLEGLKRLQAHIPEGAIKAGSRAGAKVSANSKSMSKGSVNERTSKFFN